MGLCDGPGERHNCFVERNDEVESGLHIIEEPVTSQVARALEGALWPLGREELVVIARENDGARSILSLLSGLPPGPFPSQADVLDHLETAERRRQAWRVPARS